MEEFRALTLSYKNAPIEIREYVAIEGNDLTNFLLKFREIFRVEDVLLVSTCNRTEIYYSCADRIEKEVITFLATYKGLSQASVSSYFHTLSTKEAVKHLFRVSVGLESQVLGDIQIANQVKRAYQASADLGLAGPFLHRLMHTIFYANKKVVQETRLQDGTASVASVAVDLIEHFASKIDKPKVALIGLGEIGQNALDNLKKENLDITLVNRTKARAERIAKVWDVAVGDFYDLEQIISKSDVVISAVSAPKPIIDQRQLLGAPLHKLFIDLSVPRSIDVALGDLPGVSLYNVDQLTLKTQKAKSIREQAIPDAEKIIEESLATFHAWRNEMEVSPTIQKLKKALDVIRKEELSRYSRLSDAEMELLEIATKNMIQKVIKLPVLQLKAACKRGEADTLVGVLNDLFNLEDQKVEDQQ